MNNLRQKLNQYERLFEKEITQICIIDSISSQSSTILSEYNNYTTNCSINDKDNIVKIENMKNNFLDSVDEFKEEPTNTFKNITLLVNSINETFILFKSRNDLIKLKTNEISAQLQQEYNDSFTNYDEIETLLIEFTKIKTELKELKQSYTKLLKKDNTDKDNVKELKSKLDEKHYLEEGHKTKLSNIIIKQYEKFSIFQFKLYTRIKQCFELYYKEKLVAFSQFEIFLTKKINELAKTSFILNESLEIKYFNKKTDDSFIEPNKLNLNKIPEILKEIENTHDTEEMSNKLDVLCNDIFIITNNIQKYAINFASTIEIKKNIFSSLKIFLSELNKSLSNAASFKTNLFKKIENLLFNLLGSQFKTIWLDLLSVLSSKESRFTSSNLDNSSFTNDREILKIIYDKVNQIIKQLDEKSSLFFNDWDIIKKELFNNKSTITRLIGAKERFKNKNKQFSPLIESNNYIKENDFPKEKYLEDLLSNNSKILSYCKKYYLCLDNSYSFITSNIPQILDFETELFNSFKNLVISVVEISIKNIQNTQGNLKNYANVISELRIIDDLKDIFSKNFSIFGINSGIVDKAINDMHKELCEKSNENKESNYNMLEMENKRRSIIKFTSNEFNDNLALLKNYNSDQDINIKKTNISKPKKRHTQTNDIEPVRLLKAYKPISKYLNVKKKQKVDKTIKISDNLYERLRHHELRKNIISQVKHLSTGKIENYHINEKIFQNHNLFANNYNLDTLTADLNKIKNKTLCSTKTIPEETLNLRLGEIVIDQFCCVFVKDKNKNVNGRIYITNWKIIFLSSSIINNSTKVKDKKSHSDINDNKSTGGINDDFMTALEFKNMNNITIDKNYDGLYTDINITNLRGVTLSLRSILDSSYCYNLIKYIIRAYSLVSFNENLTIKLYEKLKDVGDNIINYLFTFFKAIDESEEIKIYQDRENKGSLISLEKELEKCINNKILNIIKENIISEEIINNVEKSLSLIKNYTNNRLKLFEDNKLIKSNIEFKQKTEKCIILSSSPASLIFNSLYNKFSYCEELEKNKSFIESIFEMTERKEVKITSSQLSSSGNLLNKIPDYYSNIDHVFKIFSNNSLYNENITNDINEMLDDFDKSERQYIYDINYVREINDQLSSVYLKFKINFISPIVLIIEIYVKSEVNNFQSEKIVQLKYYSNVLFDRRAERIWFKTDVSFSFKIEAKTKKVFYGIVEKEDFKISESDYMNIYLPQMLRIMENKDFHFISRLLNYSNYIDSLKNMKIVESSVDNLHKFINNLQKQKKENEIVDKEDVINSLNNKLPIKANNTKSSIYETSHFGIEKKFNSDEPWDNIKKVKTKLSSHNYDGFHSSNSDSSLEKNKKNIIKVVNVISFSYEVEYLNSKKNLNFSFLKSPFFDNRQKKFTSNKSFKSNQSSFYIQNESLNKKRNFTYSHSRESNFQIPYVTQRINNQLEDSSSFHYNLFNAFKEIVNFSQEYSKKYYRDSIVLLIFLLILLYSIFSLLLYLLDILNLKLLPSFICLSIIIALNFPSKRNSLK